jgi:hypothetical protein
MRDSIMSGFSNTASDLPSDARPPRRGPTLLGRLLRDLVCLFGSVSAFIAYEHFKVTGNSGLSLTCLIVAALLALVPVRALLGTLFALERGVLHLFHGVGALALLALPITGVISGAPLMSHAAMAPFAIMGAAQALTHQNQPRNRAQAQALRRFAESLPEVAIFSNPGSLTTPARAAQAATVLKDLLAKAETLGQTELDADLGFQAALKTVALRTGLNLSLDVIDHSLDVMTVNPLSARLVPPLRRQLEHVRATIGHSARPNQ